MSNLCGFENGELSARPAKRLHKIPLFPAQLEQQSNSEKEVVINKQLDERHSKNCVSEIIRGNSCSCSMTTMVTLVTFTKDVYEVWRQSDHRLWSRFERKARQINLTCLTIS